MDQFFAKMKSPVLGKILGIFSEKIIFLSKKKKKIDFFLRKADNWTPDIGSFVVFFSKVQGPKTKVLLT